METILEKLKRKFLLSSRDEILKTWNSGNDWDKVGPKASDYLNPLNIQLEFQPPKIDFGNVKINDNLGSNSYSNLFFVKKSDKCNQLLLG